MAIAGTWAAGAITPSEYAGATRWGTGVNPVHAMPEAIPRGPTKLPLGSTTGDASVSEEILGPIAWGYAAEDAQFYGGEDYRYLTEDHPNWGANSTGRPDRDGDIMEVGAFPQPEGWPSWGPHNDSDTTGEFPLAGPPGGAVVRAQDDESPAERAHAIAVPTPGVTGGWLNKAHGPVLEARTSDPKQYEIQTSMVQLHRQLDNARAVARGTDERRSSIDTRLTGIKEKHYAKSFLMGGGAGTPNMFPRQQDLPYRPWFFRSAAAPPMEAHTRNTMTAWDPVQRSLPADTGETVTFAEAPPAADDEYGYTSEEGFYG
jgi:hypothetical protein